MEHSISHPATSSQSTAAGQLPSSIPITQCQITAAQVWSVLTPVQQRMLFRTLVRVCRSLTSATENITHSQEAPDDKS
jgi:hypothetical protein